MKRRIARHVFTALVLLCAVGTGWAQEPETRIGIGISMDPTRIILAGSNIYSNGLTPVNIYVPITLPHFRVEPEAGYYSFTNQSSQGTSSSEVDASTFHIGVGAFYVITTNTPVRIYVGPRVGLSFLSSKSSSSNALGSYSTESSETDFTLGMNIGGEYLFASQFSIGGEAQLNYISLGKPDVTNTPPPITTGPSADVTRHIVSSNVLFFFRWFF